MSPGLADGTIDALVSAITRRSSRRRQARCRSPKPSRARPASSCCSAWRCKWGEQSGAGLARAIEVVSAAPARLIGAEGVGRLAQGGAADLCVVDPSHEWQVTADALRSQGKHTPFSGYAMRGRARFTLVGGRVVNG